MSKELFSHASPIFPVNDVMQSAAYYRDKLGFNINFTWGEPVSYAVLKRGDVGIHLSKSEKPTKPSQNQIAFYIFVHDVDQVYEELKSKNVSIHNTIGNRDYGMRDFDITDPDGHILSFGKGI